MPAQRNECVTLPAFLNCGDMERDLRLEVATVLFDRYKSVRVLGWNLSRIGIFVNSSLLLGFPNERQKPTLICERSFQALIKLANKTVDAQKIDNNISSEDYTDLMTPLELYETYPRVIVLGWSPTKIGLFLSSQLLVGYQKGAGRSCYITRMSFLRLMEHANGTLDRRKILLNP